MQTGDRVVIFGSNAEVLEALQAAHWIGAVTVPTNAKQHAREPAHVVEDAQPSIVMTTPVFSDTVTAAGVLPERILVLGTADYAALAAIIVGAVLRAYAAPAR